MRGRLPGAQHALLSGCTRLIPHSQRRASALHQADALAAVPCGHRVGAGRRPTNTRCLARGLGGPRVRRAGDDRPRYRPPLQPGMPWLNDGPARDRRGRTPNPRTGGLFGRAGAAAVCCRGRGRWTSSARSGVYGTGAAKSPGTRGAAWVAQQRWHLAAGGDRQAEWAHLRVGAALWLGRNRG